MKSKKYCLCLLFILTLLAAVFFTVHFGAPVLIQITAKAMLTSEITDTLSVLEARFQDSPLSIFTRSIDTEGRYTVDLSLTTDNALLGPVSYAMSVKTDRTKHQVYAEGIAATQKQDFDLALYLDPDFMAVSSKQLADGNFYGITYGTFAEDLLSIPMINYFVSEKQLSLWNDSVQEIQRKMNQWHPIPQIPDFSREDIEKLLPVILAWPCKIQNGSIYVNGRSRECQILCYSAGGAKVGEILTGLTGNQYGEDSNTTISFYLYENELVKILISGTSGTNNVVYDLDLNLDSSEDFLSLRCIQHNSGDYDDRTVTVEINRSDENRVETWKYQNAENEDSEEVKLIFNQKLSDDKIELKLIEDTEEILSAVFAETEDGITLCSEDISGVLNYISMREGTEEGRKSISCEMTVHKGSEITKPSYKNLSQWSLEDFVILLSDLGTLIGINIGI